MIGARDLSTKLTQQAERYASHLASAGGTGPRLASACTVFACRVAGRRKDAALSNAS